METDRYRELAERARTGDATARQELLGDHLPLVYNVVGRALNGHPDTDDVVQETMLRAVDGLPALRDPAAFRSWLVAIAMNQVRQRHRAQQARQTDGLDEVRELPDPAGDFAELTIVRLGLSGQRREVAEATRWLDAADREVLALWWQEAAGELTRAELAAALELSPQHTAVRVQRVKERLDGARTVVRALAARPVCPALAELTATWNGNPAPLWRKRITRHVRDCADCQEPGRDLVPAEGLLAGLALLPLPRRIQAVPTAAEAPTTPVRPARRRAGGRGPGRAVAVAAGHSRVRARALVRSRRRRQAATVVGALLVLVAAGVVWDGVGGPNGTGASHGGTPADAQAAGLSATIPRTAGLLLDALAGARPTASPSTTAPSPSPSASASPTPSAAPPSSHSAAPAPTPSRTSAAPQPSSAAPDRSLPDLGGGGAPAPGQAAFITQVIKLVNVQRAQNGCGPVTANSLLQEAAQRQSDDMAARHFFDHTNPDGAGPQERIDATGYQWSTWGENIARGQRDPASVMTSWMNSPGHRANILNCAFKELGVGVHIGSGGPWWTQDFGTPA
ncbi:sigma-70 family RNA polymerase sigma factor [Kitasatospora sp. RB6PN24]|uniref:sigma-70 family RNA polymerase sigma factor n=1 Tax=Kitasatospora humi TaxID=2893891 RepID=UPI001E3714A3|nr:sigma-70 family RNA polymerase sigma factor [Kitasatospora humi]MCC9312126.1 sigma-70 family RNA polymerase sigma factor [Kitasatospora humi]